MEQTYKINLPQFEGPFDLLLFFIERDELDIYDIPISKLTDDFLLYINDMESLDIELASEFILVAASLMRIKAKMLLPRKEIDEEGNEIDPREELVRRLIEYKRFKEVSEGLKDLEKSRLEMINRGNMTEEVKHIANLYSTEAELESLTLYKLMKAFQRVVDRVERENNKVTHQIVQYDYTIKDQKDYLKQSVKGKAQTTFEKVFEVCTNRIHAIFIFLALLELVQEGSLNIEIGEGKNSFLLTA